MGYYGGWTFIVLSQLAMGGFLVTRLFSDFVIGQWASDPEQGASKFEYYCILCFAMAVGQFAAMTIRAGVLLLYSVAATKKLHGVMLRSVFEAPLNLYFDTTPIGRILNRFSKDLTLLDTQFGFTFSSTIALGYALVYTIMVAIIAVPWTALMLPFIFAWSFCIVRRVNKAIRQTTRLEATTKSPVLSHLQETLSGGPTIRAFSR